MNRSSSRPPPRVPVAPTRSRPYRRRRNRIPPRRCCAWESSGSATSGSSSRGASSGRATPCWPPPGPTTPPTAPTAGFASSGAWTRCARSSRTCCWCAAPSSPRRPSSAKSPSASSAPTPSSPTCSPSSCSPATSSSRPYLRSLGSSAHTPCSGQRAASTAGAHYLSCMTRFALWRMEIRRPKCDQFLSIFEWVGCRMVEMSCAEHDRHAAGSQFITHTIGRVLAQLNLTSTPINTKGYETLLKLTENTVSDSFDLYYGLFMYNVNATEQIDKLDMAFEKVKHMLYGRLHDILRKQIVERVPIPGPPSVRSIEVKNSSAANPLFSSVTREEKKHLSRVATAPSPPTLYPVAFSTGKC